VQEREGQLFLTVPASETRQVQTVEIITAPTRELIDKAVAALATSTAVPDPAGVLQHKRAHWRSQ
jgi:hypothetical protein